MIVLDASVLIGYLDSSDAHHASAEALLTASVDEDLGVNMLTLAEVVVAPAREGRLEAVLDVLRDLDVAVLALPADGPARLAVLRAATGLKLPDCCVLLSADVVHGTVASFDGRLLHAAEGRGMAVVSNVGLTGGGTTGA